MVCGVKQENHNELGSACKPSLSIMGGVRISCFSCAEFPGATALHRAVPIFSSGWAATASWALGFEVGFRLSLNQRDGPVRSKRPSEN